MLQDFNNGNLQKQVNDANEAYGHGTLRTSRGTLQIGGSTGGRIRELLDDYTPPSTADFYSRYGR